jgi:DNA mismatch endonuclease (patch repair protein)
MSRIRSKDTSPELLVRKELYALGFRFRLHRSDLPGKPDIVFHGRKKVIFVHGCFWHQHSKCEDGRLPETNRAYWRPKLRRNVVRDSEIQSELMRLGWRVFTVWECELKDLLRVARALKKFLGRPSFRSGRIR